MFTQIKCSWRGVCQYNALIIRQLISCHNLIFPHCLSPAKTKKWLQVLRARFQDLAARNYTRNFAAPGFTDIEVAYNCYDISIRLLKRTTR
jgi:hypothetical protein